MNEDYAIKEIKGYEGLYYIDNEGNVYSKHSGWLKKLTPYIGGGGKGYNKVSLQKGGKRKTKYNHRLVAEAFIENPWEKPCVNHLDGDRYNNNKENLEWVTHQENTQHYWQNKKSNFQNSKGCLAF